jgi:hypothetical protein
MKLKLHENKYVIINKASFDEVNDKVNLDYDFYDNDDNQIEFIDDLEKSVVEDYLSNIFESYLEEN